MIMIKLNRINKNLIKRIYAFLKENVVTFIVIGAIVLGTISAIAITQDEEVAPEEEGATYKEYTAQRIGISNIKTLDPIKSQDRDTYYISKRIYSSLFDYTDTFGLETDLVKSFKTSKKSASVTITLRDDVYFHNGSKLTAQDVAYTQEYILRNGSSGQYYDMASKIYSVNVLSTYKLKIYFRNDNDACLDNLTFPILRNGDGDNGEGFKPNGTGQYKVSKKDLDKYIKLVPNKKYYGDVAKNNIYCQVFPKSTVVENLINTYDVTAHFYRDYNGQSVAEDKGLSYKGIISNNMEYIAFNFNNPLLEKKTFRQAVAYAVDLDELVKYAYGDTGILSDSIYFPGYYGTENQGDVYKQNFGKALSLIEKLNLSDVDNDGYLDGKDGEEINLKIVVNSSDASRIMVANTISEKLEELQIKNHVERLSWEDYKAALRSRNYDLFIGGYQIEKNDKLKFMLQSGNSTGYYNEKVLKLLDNMYACNTIQKYKESYVKLKELLIDELPYYCICYKQYYLLGTPKMEFEALPTYDDIYRGINTWSYKKIVSKKN